MDFGFGALIKGMGYLILGLFVAVVLLAGSLAYVLLT